MKARPGDRVVVTYTGKHSTEEVSVLGTLNADRYEHMYVHVIPDGWVNGLRIPRANVVSVVAA